MSILTKIFGDANARFLRELEGIVKQINTREQHYIDLSDAELQQATAGFRESLNNGDKSLDDLVPDAFAAVREAARRTLNQRHYDVQLIAGLVLHRGQIAEMKTGEGKTLSATTALYLNALEGKGAHLVTVNDYLSKRDCGWMGAVYHALGMTVGVIAHDSSFVYDAAFTNEQATDPRLVHLRPVSRQEVYACDITYGTNNEFGFDYLRDNMVQTSAEMVQRPLHYAIVDEVDSILIDEARTPLIISAPDVESTDKYFQFAKLVTQLDDSTDYNVDEKLRAATLTDEGINKMEKWLGVDNIYTDRGLSEVHHIEQALKAHALYHRDRDYVVRDGEVVIVDEFTGRMLPGRRYSEGLHQAIEAKEGVAVQKESKTLATITFQNYFRLFHKLAGMTGTAATEAEEFHKIYKLEVTVVPTNREVQRKDAPDRIYKTEEAKFEAVAREIQERNATGQPVLVGTISIAKSERLADVLRRNGIEPQILNAKYHEKEALIIAEAGRKGAVTVATNMAGRGVDIKLGGEDATPEEEAEVKVLGGLHIIGTERHESRRIDNQLRGRGGRQGDPGSTQFYVSLDDDLMRIFGSDRIKGVMERLKIPDDVPIENKMVSRSLDAAQKKVEGFHFDTRKHLVEYDDVLNKHREAIYRKRRQILESSDSKDQMLEQVREEITDVVRLHAQAEDEHTWDVEEIYEVVNTIFPIATEDRYQLNQIQHEAGDTFEDDTSRGKLVGYLYKRAVEQYNKLEESVVAALGSAEAMRQIERGLLLRSIDTLWIEHLQAIDHLRSGIGLRGYGQRDPLVEYQREAFGLFKQLLGLIRKQVVYSIYKVGAATKLAPSEMQVMAEHATLSAPAKEQVTTQSSIAREADQIRSGNTMMAEQVAAREQQASLKENAQTHYNGEKVGRNDLCPCGSGKKFKQCHGA